MLTEYADDLVIDPDAVIEAPYPGLKCVTPGNPYVLHCFASFATEPTTEHQRHLDKIVQRIDASFRTARPITRVLVTGHSSTWKGTTQANLASRATKRAALIATELVIRLGSLADKADVIYEGRSDRETWTPYSSTSTSKSAQRARALNRRVEIHLIHSKPTPKPPAKPKPMTPAEMTEAVYFLLGRKPKSKARDTLFRDIVTFVPTLVKIVRGGAVPWPSLAKAYTDILSETFGSDHQAGFWFLVGSAYGVVDARPRALVLSKLQGVPYSDGGERLKFRRAFRRGYRDIRKVRNGVAKTSAGKAAVDHLTARIAATPRKWTLVLGAYRALRRLYLDDNPTAKYVRINDNPRFRYPSLGIRT